MRVLIAEDDYDLRALIEFALDAHERLVAEDGDQAIQYLQDELFDAAVLDVMMPGTDGFAVLRAIRRHADLRDIPVIMLTARTSEDDHVDGFKSGADRYLTKPFDVDELQRLLDELGAMSPEARVKQRAEELEKAQLLRRLERRF